MNIIQDIVTKNPCYSKGKKLSGGVKGMMLHSVGCSQPKASVFINAWNDASYSRACVHAFIDANDGIVYQTLPWDWRGWHCGSGSNGSGNNTHIGVEMCEPDCIKYTSGSTFTCSDLSRAKEMVTRTYNSAVELFADLCKQYNLDPLADGVIISHKEGHAKGIASNHGDPEHLWKGLGLSYTMDTFRKDVASSMGKVSEIITGAPTHTVTKFPACPFQVRVLIDDLYYRSEGSMSGKKLDFTGKATFTITEVNSAGWGKLKSGAGWIYLGNSSYCTILDTVHTNKCPYIVRVDISDLRIRKGPSTNYVWNGKYTGKGSFTIVEEKDGWGLLKSYQKDKNGWISLAYCTEV